MTTRTVNGFLGLLLIPDRNTIRIVGHLTDYRRIKHAEYRVKPEGVHLTLFQARTFRRLPISVVQRIVQTLDTLLVTNPEGSMMLRLNTIEPYAGCDKYLFWQAERHDGRLTLAHGISLGLGAWVDKSKVEDKRALERRIHGLTDAQQELARAINRNEQAFGYGLVSGEYQPHITLAADSEGFKKFKPISEPHIGSVARVVLARMGEWGKIDQILY